MAGQATGSAFALRLLYYVRENKNESQSYNLYATIKYKMIIQVLGESLDASMTVTFMNTSIDRWTDLFLPRPSVYSTHGLSVHMGYQY